MGSQGRGSAERPTKRERLLAGVALAAVVLALGLAAVSVVVNLRAAAIVVVGLLVVIAATWDALSRRGRSRSVALALAAVGLGLVVVGFVVADLSLVRLVVFVGLLGVALVCARAALRRTVVRRLVGATTPVAPARHATLLINPRSGGGKADRHHLVDECHARGIQPVVLQPGDDLLQLAQDAIARGADVIGMAGGDGSQALVADVAMQHGIPLVVVPAGTRNHFALDLGLDREDVIGALEAFTDGVERRIDVAAVNGRVFVNNVSLGVYAKVVQSPSYRDAKRRTTIDTLPDLLGPTATPLDLRFTLPDGSTQSTAHLVLVSNGPYQLHRLVVGKFRRGRLDSGELAIVAARFSNAREASRFLAMEATGRSRRFPGWSEWTSPRFRIDSSAAVEIGIDGEALTVEPPLEFECRPRALVVRLPRRAVGPEAAARSVRVLAHATLSDLTAVASRRRSVPD